MSNDVLTMGKEGIYWYRDRLSDKEWQEHYGDKTITINQNGNVIDDSLLSDDEMENVKVNIIGILQSDAIRKLYEDEDISDNSDLIYGAVDILGSSGLICLLMIPICIIISYFSLFIEIIQMVESEITFAYIG